MGRGSQAPRRPQHPKTGIVVMWNHKAKDAGVWAVAQDVAAASTKASDASDDRTMQTPTIELHRTHDAKRAHNRAMLTTLSSCRACQISSATRRDPAPRAANTCLAQTLRCSQMPSSSAALGAKFSRSLASIAIALRAIRTSCLSFVS